MTDITPETVAAEREAPKAAKRAKAQELAGLRANLREAEQALRAVETMPAESNELLATLLAEVETNATRYAHKMRGEAARPRHRMTLADLRLESADAQCYFGGARLREGLRRLFPSSNGGITDAERAGRRRQLQAEINRLTVEIARRGG